jgi:hypothetical protein
MDEKEHGEKVAGRIIYELEAVGVISLVLGAVAVVVIEGIEQWYALAGFLLVSAVAFSGLANAVLRR